VVGKWSAQLRCEMSVGAGVLASAPGPEARILFLPPVLGVAEERLAGGGIRVKAGRFRP
jgi:hypothetical protein